MADEKRNFLDTVKEQIAYRPLRRMLSQELEAHIQDRTDAYREQGLLPEEAEARAVRDMGDPVIVGTKLNAVHQIRRAPVFMALTLALLFSGFAATAAMQYSPEACANGSFYYLPGVMILLLMSWQGYPLVIRYARWLLLPAGILLLADQLLSVRGFSPFWRIGYVRYFALLLLGPFLILLAYRLRRLGGKAIMLVFGICAICVLLPGFFGDRHDIPACAILVISVTGSLLQMVHRDIFAAEVWRHRRLYGTVLAGLIFAGSLFGCTEERREILQWFVRPDENIHSTWDDTYNSVLIRRLLSETPLLRGIDLTPQELMDYGTGAWYFAGRDPGQIGIYAVHPTEEEEQAFQALVSELREAGKNPRYIYFDESDVTLWNILPQHYHNNYRIAVCILLFGWLAGVGYLAAIGGFYLLMFGCIRRIRGRLAYALSCCCGICLLTEGVFYILGNFGYQYAAFTNLPLIAEGRISIAVNMALLGFIFSAYRYDQVEMETSSMLSF